MAFRATRPTRASRGTLRVSAIKSQTQYASELIETAVSCLVLGCKFAPLRLGPLPFRLGRGMLGPNASALGGERAGRRAGGGVVGAPRV